MSIQSPLFRLFNEINLAAKNGLPLIAISSTVALPDICVSLISEDGRSNGENYKRWCSENLPKIILALLLAMIYGQYVAVCYTMADLVI